jgi:hypothetical protein
MFALPASLHRLIEFGRKLYVVPLAAILVVRCIAWRSGSYYAQLAGRGCCEALAAE